MNIHLGYRPGCIGRVVELHAGYYARTAGFGVSFEAKVACISGPGFISLCDPQTSGGLLVADDVGNVIWRVTGATTTARLRQPVPLAAP